MNESQLQTLNQWMSLVTASLVVGKLTAERRLELLNALDEFREAAKLARGDNDPEAG